MNEQFFSFKLLCILLLQLFYILFFILNEFLQFSGKKCVFFFFFFWGGGELFIHFGYFILFLFFNLVSSQLNVRDISTKRPINLWKLLHFYETKAFILSFKDVFTWKDIFITAHVKKKNETKRWKWIVTFMKVILKEPIHIYVFNIFYSSSIVFCSCLHFTSLFLCNVYFIFILLIFKANFLNSFY